MGKIIRIFGLIAGIIICLIILGAILVKVSVNPDQLKNRVIQEVYEHTGSQMTIEGGAKLSFLPRLGLQLQKIAVNNPGDAKNGKVFTVEKADFTFKLIPLLIGKVELGTLKLQHPALILVKNKQGDGNWQGVIKPPKLINILLHKKPKELLTDIAKIQILNGSFSWANEQTGQKFALQGVDLHTQDMSFSQAFPFDVGFSMAMPKTSTPTRVSIATHIAINLKRQIYQLQGLSVDFNPTEPKSSDVLPSHFSGDVLFDLFNQELALNKLQIAGPNWLVQGQVKGEHIFRQFVYDAELQAKKINLQKILAQVNHSITTPDPYALQNLSLNLHMKIEPTRLQLTHLQGTIDDSVISDSSLSIADFGSASQASSFNINIDKINMDRYFPCKFTSLTPAKETVRPVESQPFITGQLTVGHLNFNTVEILALKMQLAAAKGKFNLSSIAGNLYGGNLTGSLSLDFSDSTPQYATEFALNQVDLSQMVGPDRMKGQGNLNASLKMNGETKEEFLASLNGDIHFAAYNGQFKGVNLVDQLRGAYSFIQTKQQPPDADTTQSQNQGSSAFSQLSASAKINKGMLTTENFLFKSPVLQVTGTGSVSLLNQHIDGKLSAVPYVMEEGSRAGIRGITAIPLVVSGTLSQPHVKPDFSEISSSLIEQRFKQKIEEKKQGETDSNQPNIRKLIQQRLRDRALD